MGSRFAFLVGVLASGLWSSPVRAQQDQAMSAALRRHTRALAADAMGGRQPGTEGDKRAREYIGGQLLAAGLLPAGDVEGGQTSFFQWVDLVGVRSRPQGPPQFRNTSTTVPVQVALPPNDVILVAGDQAAQTDLAGPDLVFVGYGITAPEYQWDDYKGADLRGKILLMMNNDPESDPRLFAGKTRLYYGRWDYKYLEAARHGAAGAILIHTTPSAGYPWSVVRSSWDAENFEAPIGADAEPRLKVQGWLTEEASRRVVQAGGQDLDALRAAAERRDFRPVTLQMQLFARLASQVRKVRSANVLGILPGSDGKLQREAVVYTAHWDHLGTHADHKGPDKIFNGAIDNATGVAGLIALAQAAAQGPRPRRSLLFASVTGEEDGLIGSQHLVRHPPAAAPVLIADLNMDGLNVFGRSPQVVQIGRGKSTLDGLVDALAAGQGRKVIGDPWPDRGAFYRSDQFSFARAGIPSIYLGRPVDLLDEHGKVLRGAGRAAVERFVEQHYHQPSDEFHEAWSFDGAVQDLRLLLQAGQRLASGGARPAFLPRDEFAKK